MKILLAVDGSKASDTAVAAVATGLWPDGTEVRVVSVVEPAMLPGYDTFGVSAQFYAEVARASSERAALAVSRGVAVVEAGHPSGMTITSDSIEGHAKRAILDESERWGADLIVVGSHGHGELARILLGSVSHAVSLHAKCSVWIVRVR